MQWFGKPVVFNRFLGEVNQDDPTNLPVGLAALCEEFDFTRDSGGPTCATVRAGFNTSMQCLDPAAPVTGLLGFLYQPESATDLAFQLPLAFQPTQGSQYENPVGSGSMVKFPQSNFVEPVNPDFDVHAIQASAGNQVYSAYSDLNKPVSGMSTMDPKAKTLNPFGMKPVGFYWQRGLPVLQGEICCPPTPVTGNGHTYQAQNSGTTGVVAPVFPTADGATVNDNGIVWKEQTMVIANRLPPPGPPILSLASGGSIASGLDVYVVITLLNQQGETLPAVPVFITTLSSGTAVDVQLPALASFPRWIQNLPNQYVPTHCQIYAASVTHGQPAPALSQYCLVFPAQLLGTTFPMGSIPTATPPPPSFCSARLTPGQLPTPVVAPAIVSSPAGAVVNPPGPPSLFLTPDASGQLAGETVILALTLLNASGETTLGAYTEITLTANGQFVNVAVLSSYGPSVTGVNVYANTNTIAAPVWKKVNASAVPLGANYQVPTSLAGGSPPVSNTATLPVGSFAVGRDIYVAQTYTNASGETPLGPPSSILNLPADSSVLVNVATPTGNDNQQLFSIATVGIYEADVPTGNAAPPASAFALVGYFQNGQQIFITQTATGPNPPITNTTGTAGNVAADTATGGANGTQGFRYAAFMWINQIETFSGFTQASVVSTIIDEDGWEIGAFNIPTGMPNVVGRAVAFTIADGSQAGPFNWIGLVNLLAPAQNDVYPNQTLIDQVNQGATVILDNVTTQAIFNFTDDFLSSENNVDDRLNIAIPPQGVRADFLPSVNRLVVTGVPGYTNGAWISIADDFESFYADLGFTGVSSGGDRCLGVTDNYKSIPFAMMESGGFSLEANPSNPSTWIPRRRWGGVDPKDWNGPCGYRAWAANGKFIFWVNEAGAWRYNESDPDLMSKEVPKRWAKINWTARQNICVTIDENTHTVRILVPTGASTVPNMEYVLSYIEGWNNPIHFSTFSGREISMDAARRWSFNKTISAYLCARIRRTLPPNGNVYLDGPTFETLPDSSFLVSQLLYASSSLDGTVQARTPGIFSDNGSAIPYAYETMSAGLMQAVCKPEGFNLNAAGQGMLLPSFIASREQVTDEGGEQELIQETDEVVCDPVPLSVKQVAGITRKVAPSVNEFWRTRFAGDMQPGSWVSLKSMTAYMIPWTVGRDSGDR